MIRFMLHTTVNVRGWMSAYIKARLGKLEEEVGETIQLFTPHDPEYDSECTEEWLVPSIEKGIMPDVMVANVTEFASLEKEERIRILSKLAGEYAERNPLREELNALTDPLGIFYPISVTPLTMIYNADNVKEDALLRSWEDLLDDRYTVLFPDRDKPLSRAVGAYLKVNFPEQFARFEKRVTYSGTPANILKAVASGEYDMAMTLLSFAGVGQQGRVRINEPREGYTPLPQVIAWKQGTSKSLMTFADILTDPEMQTYLSNQDAWTVKEGVPLCGTAQDMKQLADWQGWDFYLDAVADFDRYTV